MVENTFLSFSRMPSSSHSCMIAGVQISQEIFAIDDVLTALKSSLEQRRKHILQFLPLYGDKAKDKIHDYPGDSWESPKVCLHQSQYTWV